MKQFPKKHSLSLSSDLNREKNYWFLTSLQWAKQIEIFFHIKFFAILLLKATLTTKIIKP